MSVFKTIFILYAIYAISIIVHEMAHFICAKFLRLKNIDLYIGESFFSINIKHFHISPLIVSGKVEFDFENLLCASKGKIVMLYLSGSLANLLLLFIGICTISVLPNATFIIVINAIMILINLFPLKRLPNDFGECFSALKVKKEQSR